MAKNLNSFENDDIEDNIKKINTYNKYLNYYINKHSENELEILKRKTIFFNSPKKFPWKEFMMILSKM